MAIDEGVIELLRGDLEGIGGITEKRMFGGLAFLLNGNMLCGVHGEAAGGGAMYRVGAANHARALERPGAGPMTFTGRAIGTMISVSPEGLGDDESRRIWQALALEFVKSLPAK